MSDNDDNEALTELPLYGVRVLDITANMSGPFATMILGDQGADVIKLEPLDGDPIRNVGSGSPGMSTFFANLNRSKRFIAMDLSRPESRPVLDSLLDWADVVVHNYRPAAAIPLGIDADSVRMGRERLVHVTVTGYGMSGPYAGRPAYDHVIQALSGVAARQAEHDGEPRMVRHGIVDKLAAITVAQAVSSALVRQGRSGRGCAISISMLDVAVTVLWPDGMMNHTALAPERTLPDISNGFRLTPTRDGHLAFSLVTPKQLGNLRRAVGLEEDRRFDSPGNPMRHAGALVREASGRLGGMTTDDAVALLSAYDVPVAPVVDLDELHLHPQLVANGTIESFEHPILGSIRQANPLVPFTGATAADLLPARGLGAHGREILAERGLDAEAIEALCRAGVVADAAVPGRSEDESRA